MKVFVTGISGQLGHDMANELIRRGHQVVGAGSSPAYSGLADGSAAQFAPYVPLDITDEAQVARVLEQLRPEAVIHCAAWTAVDAAEDQEDRVMAVNAAGTGYLAEACRKLDCPMVYLSTDYVFDGQGTQPWSADSRDFGPLSVYGRSKLAGEELVRRTLEKYFIVRIAWVFGASGKNFVKTMLTLSEKYDHLRVVCDQIGTPTYTRDLARLLADMVESRKYGTYHATNEGGYISWYEFACEIFRQAGKHVAVQPVTTAEYGASKAARPFNSRLDRSKLVKMGFEPLPTWQDALSRYLKEIE